MGTIYGVTVNNNDIDIGARQRRSHEPDLVSVAQGHMTKPLLQLNGRAIAIAQYDKSTDHPGTSIVICDFTYEVSL